LLEEFNITVPLINANLIPQILPLIRRMKLKQINKQRDKSRCQFWVKNRFSNLSILSKIYLYFKFSVVLSSFELLISKNYLSSCSYIIHRIALLVTFWHMKRCAFKALPYQVATPLIK